MQREAMMFTNQSHAYQRLNMSYIFQRGSSATSPHRSLPRILLALAAILLWSYRVLGQDAQLARTPVAEAPQIAVVDVGAHHRIYGRITTVTNAATKTVHSKTNIAYTEMATGLNYQDAQGNWVEATENIEITQDGGQAVHGQSQAYFPKNVNGSLMRYVTPDGVALNFKLLGLSYQDASGKSVLFAQLKDSNGILLSSSNVVVYPDAFDGVSASVRYRYTRSGYEQDVLLQGVLPDSSRWGLDAQSVVLQVLTEFVGTQEPDKGLAPMFDGTTETNLIFGVVQIGRGKAFTIGSEENTVIVRPHWLHLTDPNSNVARTFLLEQVSLQDLTAQLSQLSSSDGGGSASVPGASNARELGVASLGFHPPALKMGKPIKGPLELASAGYRETGLVLDFTTTITNGFSNYTFTNGTYYINGTANMTGITTFEDGAVLKYATNATVSANNIVWLGQPFHPIIMTSKDDNTVGDTISGSTGTPTNYFANPALKVDSTTTTNALISNFRICHAQTGLFINNSLATFSNGQVVHCKYGATLQIGWGAIEFDNILWSNVQTNFNDISADEEFIVQNNTFSGNTLLVLPASSEFFFTNCIFANVTTLYAGGSSPLAFSGNYNGFYNSPLFGVGTNATASVPFQAVGSAGFYLLPNSPFLNYGSTGVGSNLLANLQARTTFPPVVLSNALYYSNLDLEPQAQRDPGATGLTLGYHYPPIDFACGSLFISGAILTVGPGTVIAGFASSGTYSYAMGISDGATVLATGSATNPARIVCYNTVQEPSNTNWYAPSTYGLLLNGLNSSNAAVMHCRFTDFSVMAQDCPLYYDSGGIMQNPTFQDCQFHGGNFWAKDYNANVTNCLFDHVDIRLWTVSGGSTFLYNNLFRACDIDIYMGFTGCVARDNMFDQTYIYDEGSAAFVGGYNAYMTNWTNVALGNITLAVTNSSDKRLTASPTYQTGPLSRFYLPSGMTTADSGSRSAPQAGLYHQTCTTNQTIEGSSTVDIGFHLMAVDAYGRALDSYSSGLPDYLADSNGDGIFNTGDFCNWLSATNGPDGISNYLLWLQGRNPGATASSMADTNNLINLIVFTPLR